MFEFTAILQILTVFLVAAFLAGMIMHLVGFGYAIWFYSQKPPILKRREHYPSVSIIKPCLGANDNEQENFATFFEQDYPGQIQIVFSVSTDTDAAIPVIKEYIRRYPDSDARLVISRTRAGTALKVDALFDAYQASSGDIVIFSDSDTVVKPQYVSQMVASLIDEDLSLVTTPQVDMRMDGFATGMKGVANNADVASVVSFGMLAAAEKRFVWGHSIGFKRKEFDEVGDFAWYVLNRYIVDDQAMPHIYNAIGKKTGFRNIYCPVQWSGKSLREVFKQKKSWSVFQQAAVGNRLLYLLASVMYPQVPAFFLLFITGFSTWSILLNLWAFAARTVIALVHEQISLGTTHQTRRYFWLIPLWDISQFYFVTSAFFQKTVRNCGKSYRIGPRFFLEPEPVK